MHTDPKISYAESVKLSRKSFENSMRNARKFIFKQNKQAKVIWRLHPHVGNTEECIYLRNETTASPHDPIRWTNTSTLAKWVVDYNEIVEQIATEWHDSSLDWFTMSMDYIDYSLKNGWLAHADAVHWCAEGLPRGANILLQDVLYDLQFDLKRIQNMTTLSVGKKKKAGCR